MRRWNRFLQRVMTGRYGTDRLSGFLSGMAVLCMALAFLSRNFYAALVFELIMLFILLFNVYRMFSRNFARRQGENLVYMKYRTRFRNYWEQYWSRLSTWWNEVVMTGRKKRDRRWSLRDLFHSEDKVESGLKFCIYPCPGCGTEVKVPANKGKICIRCPRCGTEFIRNS